MQQNSVLHKTPWIITVFLLIFLVYFENYLKLGKKHLVLKTTGRVNEIALRNVFCLGMLAGILCDVLKIGKYCGEFIKIRWSIHSRPSPFTANATRYFCNDWIDKAFHVLRRPYWRPPWGEKIIQSSWFAKSQRKKYFR